MLKATAGTRSPLELWPGPLRLLVLRVDEDETGRRFADMSVKEGEGPVQTLRVSRGEEIHVGGRRFRIEKISDDGEGQVDFEQIRTAEAPSPRKPSPRKRRSGA